MNIQDTDELQQQAWEEMSRHCADCGCNKFLPATRVDPEDRWCDITDNSKCPAVEAVEVKLAEYMENQHFDHAYFEEAIQDVLEDVAHFSDHNNTEGLLKTCKDALKAARFEQAKGELI